MEKVFTVFSLTTDQWCVLCDCCNSFNFKFYPGSDLGGAFALLHEAETKLKRIVHDKFEAAIQNGDRNSVERYCKFYLLNNAPIY